MTTHRSLSPCPVCGGRQESEDGVSTFSMHDRRFHDLLERIEALEAELSRHTGYVASAASVEGS